MHIRHFVDFAWIFLQGLCVVKLEIAIELDQRIRQEFIYLRYFNRYNQRQVDFITSLR